MRNSECGVVLILSFIILVTMASMVGTYLFTTSIVTKSAGFGEVDDKVIALAEAGLRKAVWYLMTPIPVGRGENWTTAGTTESLGSGTYTMVVAGWNFALAANGSTASASSSSGGNPPSRAIDGNDTTYWQSRGGPPQTITVNFPYTLTINKIRFLVPAGFQTPRNYTWQVSPTGSTYTTIITVTNQPPNIRDITHTFSITVNPAAAATRFLMLSVTALNNDGGGASRVRVATIQVIGSKITSTGTIGSLSRTVTQTVVADDGSPQNQVAFYEPDWVEQ